MHYDKFAEAVKLAGLTPRFCNPLHWQIRGGRFVVNFYPETKRGPRFYVNCFAHGQGGNLEIAVQAALGQFALQPTSPTLRKSRNQRRRWKRKMLRKKPFCHYCGVWLTRETATLDHFVPFDKGGGDFENNYRLACARCNSDKNNKLPDSQDVVSQP